MKKIVTVFKAGLYLYVKLSKIEPKCREVDFVSLLSENHRKHLPNSSILSGIKRGNTTVYGKIEALKVKGKVMYRLAALDMFIDRCIRDPRLLEYMTRRVD